MINNSFNKDIQDNNITNVNSIIEVNKDKRKEDTDISTNSKDSFCLDNTKDNINNENSFSSSLKSREIDEKNISFQSIKNDSNIFKYLMYFLSEIIIVLLIEALRDDIVFAFIREKEIDTTEAFSSLCLIFDLIKTALPFSFTQGYGFLASKCFSSGHLRQLGKYTNKMDLILFTSSIFFALLFLVVLGPLFSLFIENPATSQNLTEMFRWLAVGVPFSFLKFGGMRYLNSINKGYIATIASFVGVLVQIGFLFLFINHLQLINFGVSMSIALGMMVNWLIQFIYIKWYNPYPETIVPFNDNLYIDMWKFIKQNLTYGAIVYLSIFSFDSISYLGLLIGDQEYTVINFISILLMIVFLISDSITASSNILINYAIGTKQYQKSVTIFIYSLIINTAYALLMVIISLIFYKNSITYFTSNNALIYIADKQKVLFVILMVISSYHSAFSETLSAIGGEEISLVTTFFFRLVLSIVLGITFIKWFGMALEGILHGMLIGQIVTTIVNAYYIYIFFKNDGEVYIKKEQIKIEDEMNKRLENEEDNGNNKLNTSSEKLNNELEDSSSNMENRYRNGKNGN